MFFFLANKNMDGNKERDKKQSALPKELQEKFMTTDSAVLQTKKLNSGEHYADLDTSWVDFVSGIIKCNICT